MPRKTKLSRKLIERLALAVRKGLQIAQACEKAGIAEGSYYRWLSADEAGVKRNPLIGVLREAIQKAEARFEDESLQRIREAGRGGAVVRTVVRTTRQGDTIEETTYSTPAWQADAFLLERKHPDRYSRLVKTDVTSKGQAVKGYIGFSPEEWDEHQKEQGTESKSEGSKD